MLGFDQKAIDGHGTCKFTTSFCFGQLKFVLVGSKCDSMELSALKGSNQPKFVSIRPNCDKIDF